MPHRLALLALAIGGCMVRQPPPQAASDALTADVDDAADPDLEGSEPPRSAAGFDARGAEHGRDPDSAAAIDSLGRGGDSDAVAPDDTPDE